MVDEIDRHILDLLLRDGRLPLEHVARAVNLSRPAVQQRVRRLEQRSVIKGYTVQVDWSQLGYPILAQVNLVIARAVGDAAAALLATASPGVLVTEAHRTAGEFCLSLMVRAASTLALQDFIDALRRGGHVASTHTTIILSTLREGVTDDVAASFSAAAGAD